MKVIVASPWIPAEWIRAHGHEPCGVWFHPGFGSPRAGVGEGVCPFAQRVLRLAEARTEFAFVFATHCDQLRRAHDSIGGAAADRSFLFNLPATWQTGAVRKLICAELKRLGDFLVQVGGRAPTAQLLAHHLQSYRAARTELARAGRWCYGSAYANAVAQFHREGSFKLPPRRQPAPGTQAREENRAPRLALIGGPLGTNDMELIGQIEAMGGALVLNATESGERTLAPHALDQDQEKEPWRPGCDQVDGMADELAQCILDQCVDVFQRPNTRLYAWLDQRLAERKVQGLILWHHVACDLWRAEAEGLREAFKLPLLLLEADESGGSSQRNAGRVQAFLEALR